MIKASYRGRTGRLIFKRYKSIKSYIRAKYALRKRGIYLQIFNYKNYRWSRGMVYKKR